MLDFKPWLSQLGNPIGKQLVTAFPVSGCFSNCPPACYQNSLPANGNTETKQESCFLTYLILYLMAPLTPYHITQSASQSRPNHQVWQHLLSPNISMSHPVPWVERTMPCHIPAPYSSCLLCQENLLPSLCQWTVTPSTLSSNGTPSRDVPLLLHHPFITNTCFLW